MIGRLTGTIVAEDGDGTVIVDVGGVGYEVFVPAGAAARATTEGGKATFHVHTHAREDALILFGFATVADRTAFRSLIGVSNVGPKTAIAVLSALPADELARAVAARDVGKLVRIPGIGKKTAERLVLELRDRMIAAPAGAVGAAPPAERTAPGAQAQRDVLTSALTRMGYRPAEAERAAQALGPKVETATLADLVREALAILAK